MKLTRNGVIYLAIAAVMGVCAGCATRPAEAIRVASCNIRCSAGDKGTENAWPERKEDLVRLVKSLDLDVFGMQEVCTDQAAYLKGKLSEFEFVGDHRGADRKSDEASPVCYRKSRFEAEKRGTFWLSETPEVPGSKSWNTCCTRVCSYLILRDKTNGKRFCFANTHTDHRSELAREKGMMLIIERMKEFGQGAPIIFTGDHNCRETEKPAQAVSKILKNALYVSESEPEGSWRTFHGWKWRDEEVSIEEALKQPIEARNERKSKYGPRIDYIYVSDGIRVLDYKSVNESRPDKKLYPSDHFPQTATIVLP